MRATGAGLPDSDAKLKEPPQTAFKPGNWLRQYGQFLDGELSGPATDADRIRQYVLEHDFEPAREKGRGMAAVLVRDVNAVPSLKDAWPNICQALAGPKFRELAPVPPPERVGADQSLAIVLRFDLSDHPFDRSALDQARDRFLAACPDFRSFAIPGTGWAGRKKARKAAASERVYAVAASASPRPSSVPCRLEKAIASQITGSRIICASFRCSAVFLLEPWQRERKPFSRPRTFQKFGIAPNYERPGGFSKSTQSWRRVRALATCSDHLKLPAAVRGLSLPCA